MTLTYVDAGVDQSKKDKAIDRILEMMRRTHDKGVIDLPWGFAGLYSLVSSPLFKKPLKHPVLVACTDGVGTKLKLARTLGIHDTVGIDLVA
ncbi:MAG TPA: phosphoribosylformylglycinamidine cyclo-ligase, partial [Planctomycetota bacterium]|nr:phosphoribosylformylglycinamidine cyclo-ligase [Planctomycetota bacterium]